MIYNAIDIADYIIEISDKDIPVTNLTIQKMLYYIQVMSLVNTGEPIFTDDIVLWKHGPVIPNVYYKYLDNGIEHLKNPIGSPDIDDDTKKTIEFIYNELKHYNIWELVEMSKASNPYKYSNKHGIISDKDIIYSYNK